MSATRDSSSQPSVRRVATVARGVPDVKTGEGAAALISTTDEWKDLQKHKEHIDKTHLRDLINDPARCEALTV